MLRTAFCLGLLFVIATSALTVPAYSLTIKESGPLMGFSQLLPALQGVNTITVNGLTVDRSAIKTDFGAIDLGEMKYNGNPRRTLITALATSRLWATARTWWA